MGAMERRKGATFEREVAVAFRDRGFKARRGLGQARDSGEVPDVDVEGVDLWPELKRGRLTNPRAALAQAQAAASDHATRHGGAARTPIAITRDDGAGPIVTCSLEHYLDLLARANGVAR
jgi:hypothetical protein